MPADHALVKRIQATVGERLQAESQAARKAGRPPLSGEDERQYSRTVIAQAIGAHVTELLSAGDAPLDWEAEAELSQAVFARLYGAGRLQHMIDDEQIENIDINGCDEVWITYAGGQRVAGPSVAESDEELIELVQTLGSYSGLNARPFDSANPELDLRLPDGSRLSAVMRVTARPAVSIRRHRFAKVTLDDLVGNGTMSAHLAAFLTAAVRARLNIMIAGATNAGKTTLLRALTAAIPRDERIVTVENSLELGLRQHLDSHPNVVELEAALPNSEGQGAVTMQQLVRRTLRMNPDRVIVGEVLGPEIVTMINAMSQGNEGSLSTIHARTPRGVFDRIATYARQAEEGLDPATAHMLISGGLDLVVYVSQVHDEHGHRRQISGVLEVNGFDGNQVTTSLIWVPGSDGAAVPNADVAVSRLPALRRAGYEPHAWPEESTWGWA